MLKCSKGEGTAELEEALATVLDIIKSVNDSMHQIAITGFEVSIHNHLLISLINSAVKLKKVRKVEKQGTYMQSLFFSTS